jgi:hypothetical protein
MGTQGAATKLCMDPTAVDTMSEPYEFISCTLRKTTEIVETGGIRGTRSHSKEVSREGISRIAGSIVLTPSPADLDLLLPRILGTAESSDSFVLAETLPSFHVGVDYSVDAFEYQDCFVNRAIFRGSSGGFLQLELDIIGTAQADLSYPSLTLGVAANNEPYRFSEGVLTLVSSARPIRSFELIIDNVLDAQFHNTLTAPVITPHDRIITLNCTTPYTSDEVALFTQTLAGTTATLAFTNAAMSTTFTFGVLEPFPLQGPTIPGKSEVVLEQTYRAMQSTTTKELVVTSDSVA